MTWEQVGGGEEGYVHDVISQQVFIKSFSKSQFPHKFVNLFFILVMIKDKSTNLYGN